MIPRNDQIMEFHRRRRIESAPLFRAPVCLEALGVSGAQDIIQSSGVALSNCSYGNTSSGCSLNCRIRTTSTGRISFN